jgi:hypothetical protein
MITKTKLQDTLGVGLPNVYFNTITLSNGGDVRRAIQDPHIDHPNETSVANLNEISDTIKNKSLNININIVLKEAMTENATLNFLTNKNILEYINVAVVQCTSRTLHDAILKNPSEWLKDSTQMEQYSGLKKNVISISEFILSKTQSSTTGETKAGITETNAAAAINQLPYAKNQDSQGNIVFDIGLSTDFIIGPSEGGANVNFLSYFSYAYFDLNQFLTDSEVMDQYNVSQDFLDVLSIGEASSELVIAGGNTNTTSFVFLDDQNNYWLGPIHQMEDGSWMKGTEHPVNPVESDYLTKVELPNSKIVDNREVINVEQINLDYLKFSDYFTNDEALLALTKSLKTDGIYKKKPQLVSDLYLTRDKFNNARFMFSLNVHESIKNSTIFPGLLDAIKKVDKLEYNKIINNSSITEFKLYRQRVRSQEVIQSDINRTSFSSLDAKKLIVNSSDSNGYLKTVTSKTKIKKSKKDNVFKIGSIKESVFKIKNNIGIRSFTGTDFDIAKQLDGMYEYSLEVSMSDPVVPYLISKLSNLSETLNGSVTKFAGKKFGLKEYYHDAISSPAYYDTYTNRFTLDFLEFYGNKYGDDGTTSNFLSNAIGTYTEILILMGFGSKESVFDSFKLFEYLYKLSSPNTGSPDGVGLLIKLIEDFIEKLDTLLKSATAYAKKPQQGTSNSLGNTPNILGGKAQKTFKLEHDFKTLYDASIPASFGLDYLSMSEDEPLNNLEGLLGVTSGHIQQRTEKEVQKYFTGQAVDISIQDSNLNGSNTLNPGDSIENKRYTFLSPSLVKIPTRTTTSILSNGSLSQDYKELNDLALDIARYNEDTSKIGTLLSGDEKKSGAISIEDQKRRFDLVSYFAEKGTTFSTFKPLGTTTNATSTPSDSNAATAVGNTLLDIGSNIFLNTENSQTTFGFNDVEILDSSTNPNTLLQTLFQINDTRFFSKYNQQIFYDVSISGAGKTFKDELLAYALISGIAGAFGEETEEQAPLTRGPNQLKALMLSFVKSQSVKYPTIFEAGIQKDPLKNPQNFGFIYFNYKNLTRIEVLRSFNMVDESLFLGEPVWTDLQPEDLTGITNVPLLCRHKRHTNLQHGFDTIPKLQMPSYDEYFFLTPESNLEDIANQAELIPSTPGVPSSVRGVNNRLSNPQRGTFGIPSGPRNGALSDFKLKKDKYMEQRVLNFEPPTRGGERGPVRNEYTKSTFVTNKKGIDQFGINIDPQEIAKETNRVVSMPRAEQSKAMRDLGISEQQIQGKQLATTKTPANPTTSQDFDLKNDIAGKNKGTTYNR